MRKLTRVWPLALAVVAVVAETAGAETNRPPVGRIAFVRFDAVVAHPRVFVVGAGGRGATRLELPATAATAPAWSRDGRRLAFVGGTNAVGSSELTGATFLYVGTDGHGRALTPRGVRVGGPAWAPDGSRIVFVRAAARGNGSSLWAIRPDGRGALRITFGSVDLEPAWSPDGRSIAFVRIEPKSYRSGVFLVRPDGRGLRRILVGLRNATEPVWSPDGKRLLVEDGRAISSVRPDGSGLRRVVELAADARGRIEDPQPAYSPDGSWVVFCQLRRGAVGRSDLWLVRPDGGGLRRLTHSPELDTDPAWGP